MAKNLIIVTGGPGTGKSYISKIIFKNIMNLEIISYDDIKEKNWDRFGFDNIEEKNVVNSFSLEEFYLTLENRMRLGENILIEYPFNQIHIERFDFLVKKYLYNAITVYMHGELYTVYERGIARDNDVNRHFGHLTNHYFKYEKYEQINLKKDAMKTFDEFVEWISHKNYNIKIGRTIDVDVTDYSKINYEKIINKINEFMIH